jgi:hypothetical protein
MATSVNLCNSSNEFRVDSINCSVGSCFAVVCRLNDSVAMDVQQGKLPPVLVAWADASEMQEAPMRWYWTTCGLGAD